MCESVEEIEFATKKFKKEVLDEVDFEQIYKGIVSNLPGKKWHAEHTEYYLEQSMKDWFDLQDLYKQEIRKF